MKLKKMISTMLICGTILGTSITAFASVDYVGGGKWDYGTGGGKVWSNYSHDSRVHKSSVQGKQFVSSGWVQAGTTSYASAPDRWYAADNSYWDVQ